MSDEQKPGDPADLAIDAKADGAFGGAVSHRAGYGGIEFEGQTFTKLEWAERTARMGGTLAAGEGRMLLAEIDRLRAAAKDSMDHYTDARAEIDRLRALEIVMAQHEDTGRTWNGPRSAIPSRYFEVNNAEQLRRVFGDEEGTP